MVIYYSTNIKESFRRRKASLERIVFNMSSKYIPLNHYLTDMPDPSRDITLSFEHIERMFNEKLPPSAHNYPAWWANQKYGSHIHARAW